uniref:Mitochondrial distribution and morphology protein 12 n=1 Tax=Talaromyces stipitatus (strain ATCC 10500 / CBS 375.48 / QM 6759 / NRRL 1006) TaxID=441959 RepID=MDM12_TALSN|nr:RecName: Full=Mitochondrial distribution and morphology protein 12; AltName: Full=Mitochondrial inheritance component mdm12 [Talaromyces stipitatus ATCC 10500]
MSIDLNWEAATSGPDGEQLAERIRSFIHDKFQQVPLPRFIRSVNVHSFEFGSIAPELEIKDICDPFVDFYEESDSSEDEDGEGHDAESDTSSDRAADSTADKRDMRYGHDDRGNNGHIPNHHDHLRTSQWVAGGTDGHSTQSPLRSPIGLGDHLNAHFRSTTPNILPGVTSNLGYHLMMGNLSGTQTPLAAVAGGTPFGPGWPDAVMNQGSRMTDHTTGRTRREDHNKNETGSPSRPSTAHTNPTQLSHGRSAASSSNNTSNDPTVIYNDHTSSTTATTYGLHEGGDRPRDKHGHRIDQEEPPPSPTPHMRERRPEDFQVICRVKYAGDVKLSLTAEILLDYPMPSFVGLPLKLNITGITFDGVAVVAYIRRRAHLCFLSPEDADALLGDEDDIQHPSYSTANTTTAASGSSTDNNNNNNESNDHPNHPPQPRRRFGSLLQQIRVDSEIGRKENGKQALKNVGKVERFVLDQVRRIFEDEFVFPSYWTFLV